MNHIFINEQNIRELMQRLLDSEPIQSGRFQLYRDVPVQLLEYTAPFYCRRKNLATMDCSTALQSIDFLICREDMPVLALTFDIDPKESASLFNTVLHGLPHYSVHLLSFLAVDIDDILWQILTLLSGLEQDAPVCPYRLQLIPMEQSYCAEEFQKKRFVNADGCTTIYGRSCGLVFQLTSQEVLPWIACKVPGSPLRDMQTVPQDAHAADALQILLQAPVSDFLSGAFPDLTLEQFIALSAQTDLNWQLRSVVRALCDPCTLQHFPILQMPLKCYFEASAARSGSHFPIWKYQHDVLPFLNPDAPEDSFTLAAALQNALGADARPTLQELLLL